AGVKATPHEPTDGSAALAAVDEYAIESSIAKVAGSEMLDYVLDENVQIHGGNGFVRDYPAERHYRDARVNRIFEGTNEINRLLIPGMLAKRAAKNELPIIAAAKRLQDELLGPPSPCVRGEAAAKQALAAMAEGDTLRTMLAALRRLTKVTPVNTVVMRRRLADATVARGGYVFG